MPATLEQDWTDHLQTVRWYGGKGSGASVTRLDALPPHTAPGTSPIVRSSIATLTQPGGRVEHYHLLEALYPEDAEPSGTVVGRADVEGRTMLVVDATTDEAALAAFVAATAPSFADRTVGVWKGEQSNTTLTLGKSDLYKLFRKVEPGPNLETEVLEALGGDAVPEVRGRLTADWPAGTTTDLGVVVERVAGAQDGWEIATRACADGVDFTEDAHALGVALRTVHGRLADAFGVQRRSGDDVADVMERRLRDAVADAPELEEHADALRATFGTLRGADLDVQRVHGDFHLGQTLFSPAGWTIIDFEGEPAKTARERREFDSPWRDVAGMVRSFDYVRSAHPDPASEAATTWADAAREAFLNGYCGGTPRSDVLAGYVVDKAVYEVLYELRNRPDWVGIPMRAIRSVSAPAAHEPSEKE